MWLGIYYYTKYKSSLDYKLVFYFAMFYFIALIIISAKSIKKLKKNKSIFSLSITLL